MGRVEHENGETDRTDNQEQKIDATLDRRRVWINSWRHVGLRQVRGAIRPISAESVNIISRKTSEFSLVL